MEMIVKTMAGFEEVLAQELEALGATEITPLNRAVRCTGDQALLYKSNLWLRTGLRVLVPMAYFDVENEQDLYHAVQGINWGDYLTLDKTFAIQAVTQSAQLNHNVFLALKTKDAIADWFREKHGKRPNVNPKSPDVRIHLHIDSLNHCTLSLDSSGEGLHRRGYRTDGGGAPLNEVLAAGLVLLSGWQADTPFVDFMCGSGTILIEAANYAYNRPPGSRRNFGFQSWLDYDSKLWHDIQAEAKEKERPFEHPIIGNDSHFRAIRIATQNIDAAGLHGKISLKRGNLTRFTPPEGPGWLISNPPYDMRMEDDNILGLYKLIGDKLKTDFAGYNAWIFSGNREALKHVGLRPSRKIPLFNGTIECRLQRYELYQGSRKASKSNTGE